MPPWAPGGLRVRCGPLALTPRRRAPDLSLQSTFPKKILIQAVVPSDGGVVAAQGAAHRQALLGASPGPPGRGELGVATHLGSAKGGHGVSPYLVTFGQKLTPTQSQALRAGPTTPEHSVQTTATIMRTRVCETRPTAAARPAARVSKNYPSGQTPDMGCSARIRTLVGVGMPPDCVGSRSLEGLWVVAAAPADLNGGRGNGIR